MPEEKKENNQESKSDAKAKKCCCSCGLKKFVMITIVVILIIFLAGWACRWKRDKDQKVSLGLSSPNFPHRDYTQEELNKMYPQVKNADVPTRVTPEETYAKLKEALMNEDVEGAVDCFVEEKRGEWREVFEKAKDAGELKNIANELPDKMKHSDTYETRAYYNVPQEIGGKIFEHPISFVKNSNGDWKIEIF